MLTLTAVVALLIAVAGALIAGRAGNEPITPEAGSIEAIAEELAAGQAQDRTELTADLAAAAEDAHGHLSQVLQELASSVQLDGSARPDRAGVNEVDGWKLNVRLASDALSEVEDGTSEQAVAREAFIGAAQLLDSSASDYRDYLAAPPDEQKALAATVVERRDAAVRLWQAGAAQLDTLTLSSDGRHVHLFLAPSGDPDDVPAEFREPEGHE
jgi:hypothetical protein